MPVQDITGTSALAARFQEDPNYVANGSLCEAYGCVCDHPSGHHDVAVYNDGLARAHYEQVIKPWGPVWCKEAWDQEYACTTTGDAGTPKSLLSRDDMEIMGLCWAKALFVNNIVNILTGAVYEDCKNKDCRMCHDNLLSISSKNLDLMKMRMMDMKSRPRNPGGNGRTQNAAGKAAQQAYEDDKKAKNAAKTSKGKETTCPNCRVKGHKQQECDDTVYPNIHEFCWMCNVHGHSAPVCRAFKTVENWESNFNNRCITAVANKHVVHDQNDKPLFGPGSQTSQYEVSRKIKGEGDSVPWTLAQLDIRRNNKATEQAKMWPFMQKIRNAHPTLMPDKA